MQNLDRNVDVFVMTQKLNVEDPQMQFSYRLADVLVMAQRLTVDDVSGCSCHDEKTDGGIPKQFTDRVVDVIVMTQRDGREDPAMQFTDRTLEEVREEEESKGKVTGKPAAPGNPGTPGIS